MALGYALTQLAKSKKSRTIAKKRAARLAALAALDPEVKVPIEEQTIDLPFATVSNAAYGPATRAAITRTVAAVGGIGSEITEKVTGKGQKLSVKATTVEIGRDAAVQVTTMDAANARIEVKKAMRKKGRSKIKEGNFLAQM